MIDGTGCRSSPRTSRKRGKAFVVLTGRDLQTAWVRHYGKLSYDTWYYIPARVFCSVVENVLGSISDCRFKVFGTPPWVPIF